MYYQPRAQDLTIKTFANTVRLDSTCSYTIVLTEIIHHNFTALSVKTVAPYLSSGPATRRFHAIIRLFKNGLNMHAAYVTIKIITDITRGGRELKRIYSGIRASTINPRVRLDSAFQHRDRSVIK